MPPRTSRTPRPALTICAEAAALSLANSAGDPEIDAIAVVGFNFIDEAAGASRVVTPCGSCRQLIAEAAQRANASVRVICCDGELSNIAVWTVAELLPNAFGPENLPASRKWPAVREELRVRRAANRDPEKAIVSTHRVVGRLAACLWTPGGYSRFRCSLPVEGRKCRCGRQLHA